MKKYFRFEDSVDASKIQEAIAVSRAAFLAGESERTVSYLEFLYQQSKYIKKRWWLIQGVLLACAVFLLYNADADFSVRRILGLTAPLFVILIVPEIWKNRSFDALEVECTTYYPLRSLYAARLTLFAGVDVALLSAFFAGTSCVARIPLWEMLTQFLLPFNVTCCICFRTLYSKRIQSESLSLLLCALWTALWSLVILDDAVYHAISIPVWALALGTSLLYMGYVLSRGQKQWQNILEVKPLWI
ncbi:MAG: hypothetical protein ACI3WQ_09685 [Faecousia sp.]